MHEEQLNGDMIGRRGAETLSLIGRLAVRIGPLISDSE